MHNHPRKRKAVIVALAKEEGLQMDILKNATQNRGLSKDVIERIIQFYHRDDITWQAPGRKDVVLIRRVKKWCEEQSMLCSPGICFCLWLKHTSYTVKIIQTKLV